MFSEFGINAGFVEDLHAQYRQSPQSVPEEWRAFFQSLDTTPAPTPTTPTNGTNAAARARTNGAAVTAHRDETLLSAAALSGRVYQLVNAYRVRGHLFAKIDPLGTSPDAAPELDLSNFGLSESDYDTL